MSSLPPDYLEYPLRRYGMDHAMYEWSMLRTRKPLAWPDQSPVALVVVPVLEWFPLNHPRTPVAPPGGLTTAYPDLRHYSLRDYGSRVGIYRILSLLDRLKWTASVAVQSAVATRYPTLLAELTSRRYELVGHGIDMGHLTVEGVDPGAERTWLEQSLRELRRGAKVTGYLSPGRLQSRSTLALCSQVDLGYTLDLANDELPYPLTVSNDLWSMPLSPLLSDRSVIFEQQNTEEDFADAIHDHHAYLAREARELGPRLMTVTLYPWISGQPHRIAALERALSSLSREKLWVTTFQQVLAVARAQLR